MEVQRNGEKGGRRGGVKWENKQLSGVKLYKFKNCGG